MIICSFNKLIVNYTTPGCRGIFIFVHLFISEANPKSNAKKSTKKVKKAGKASFRRGHGKRAKGGDVFDDVPEMPPMPPPLSDGGDSDDEGDGGASADHPKDRV